jgi:hypothetical protein
MQTAFRQNARMRTSSGCFYSKRNLTITAGQNILAAHGLNSHGKDAVDVSDDPWSALITPYSNSGTGL